MEHTEKAGFLGFHVERAADFLERFIAQAKLTPVDAAVLATLVDDLRSAHNQASSISTIKEAA